MAKNNEFISYGKGHESDDHVYYIPYGAATLEQLKDIDFDIKTIATAVGLGEIDEDGIKHDSSQGEGEPVNNQAGMPVAMADGDYKPTVEMNLMQTAGDKKLDEVMFGKDNVVGTDDSYIINKNNKNKTSGIYVFETPFKNGGKERIIYPRATIYLAGEINDNSKDVRLYPAKLEVLADEFGNASYVVKTAKAEVIEG